MRYNMNEMDAPKNDKAVRDWLTAQITDQRPTLLAFADDGVIWGKKVDGKLVASHEISPAISPALRGETLQQAFVFGAGDEMRLFRDETGQWQALRVVDGEEVIRESQVLWGDEVIEVRDGFTYLRDKKQQGLEHIVPIEVKLDDDQCLRLDVHHMVEYDQETGEARIVLSRLAGLRVGEKSEEVKT